MATITAIKTGNWNDPTVWDSGTVPGAGDVACSGAYTVALNISPIECAEIRTNHSSGKFTTATPLNIYADIVAQEARCLEITHSTIIYGNVRAGDAGSYPYGIWCNHSTFVHIYGNVFGGGMQNAVGVFVNSTGSLRVYGTVTGGLGQYAFGVRVVGNANTEADAAVGGGNQSAGFILYAGTLTCGTATGGAGNDCPGIKINFNSTATVTADSAVGNDYGAPGGSASMNFGIHNNSINGTVICKKIVFGPAGMTPVGGMMKMAPDAENTADFLSSAGGRRLLTFGSGSCDYPAETDVRSGTAFDNLTKTGTLDLPAETDVRAGTAFDNLTKTGTLDLPAESNVRAGTAFDHITKTGTLDLPAESNVREGTAFDHITKTGTLDLPAVGDVRAGTAFDNLTKTGTLDLPSAEEISAAVWSHETRTLTDGSAESIAVIRDMTCGRWKLASNQMIFYKEDNLTEIMRFDLKDAGGSPASENVFERVKNL